MRLGNWFWIRIKPHYAKQHGWRRIGVSLKLMFSVLINSNDEDSQAAQAKKPEKS